MRVCYGFAVQKPHGILAAHLLAAAAADASSHAQTHFWQRFPAFRVVAPQAPQRTALEEDGCPNPRSVVNGVLLDVEYASFRRQLQTRTVGRLLRPMNEVLAIIDHVLSKTCGVAEKHSDAGGIHWAGRASRLVIRVAAALEGPIIGSCRVHPTISPWIPCHWKGARRGPSEARPMGLGRRFLAGAQTCPAIQHTRIGPKLQHGPCKPGGFTRA